MFGIRRGLKRGVSKLAKRGKNDSPETTEARSAPRATPAPAARKAAPKATPTKAPEPTPAQPVAAAAPKPEATPAAVPSEKPAEKPSGLTGGLSGIAAMISAGAAEESNEIDLSVSYTSGPAAEAAAVAMAARNMINHAEDGTAYWGAVDNDSARSRAIGEILVIDQWECIQCGTCVENTEQVFALPDDAKAVVFRQEGPMELIQDAIDACPVTCIHWTTEPEQYEQLNDIEGNELSA